MEPTKLILIRHGETAGNHPSEEMQLVGWTDLPLTDRGRREAEALREWLSRFPPADGLYSSPLQRAREIALRLGECSRRPLVLLDDLREISCGELDGVSIDEVQERFPDLWAANLRQEDENFRWPGGESYRELRERSLAAMNFIARRHPGGRVLAVTHSGVISQVAGWIHGVSPARWEKFRPDNGSLTEIDWGRESAILVHYNERRHLAEKVAP